MQNTGFKKEWLLLVGILMVTFLVFSPVLKGDFLTWDDDVNVTANPNVQELNRNGIKQMFTHSVIGGYTPITTLSFAIEKSVFGLKPGVFHFNNLLLHLLCTLLVFILFKKLGANLFITSVITILFGIHPMRVESVAWITERKDLLYSFFYLLSLISYITFRKTHKPVFYLLTLGTFVFALLSKIQAVSLPLILLLVDYFFENKIQPKQLLNKIPFFILSLATGLAGIYFLREAGTLESGTSLPLFQRILVGTFTICIYLVKSIIPYQLSAIYPYPEKLSVLFYASILIVIILAFLIYKSGKIRKPLVLGSFFFLFNVMFVLQIVGAGQAFLADRFTYIPYIGLFFLIACGLNYLNNSRYKPLAIGLGLIYLSILGVMTWQRSQVWMNSETLFTDVIRKYPDGAVAYNNLGLYYREKNQDAKAIEAYSRSIEKNPDGYLGYSNRGEALFGQGHVDKALADLNRAIQLNPDNSKALSNRGAALGSKGEFSLALSDLNKAIKLDVNNLQAYSNRALVYYSLGNFGPACEDATTFLLLKPNNPDLLNLRGLCFNRLNKNQEAFNDFSKAIQINPRGSAYYQNRSYLLKKMGDSKGAFRDILKAKELGAKVDPAHINP